MATAQPTGGPQTTRTARREGQHPPPPEPLRTPVLDSHCHLDISTEKASLSVDEALAAATAVGVPRLVQIGHEDELLLVDLEARGAVDELARLPAEDRPRAYEVWPPLDATVDHGGRRLEVVVAVIDEPDGDRDGERAAAAIAAVAAAGRVPPPRVAPAAEGWRTFKLFGAAERTGRLLVGAIAPAITDALVAGELDQWFFLPYVDGPGRREHLRLQLTKKFIHPIL